MFTTRKETFRILSSAGYSVTEDGRILNPKGKEIRGSKTKMGYRVINFRHPETGKTCLGLVHYLIAGVKFGEVAFDDAMEIRHLDGNSGNIKPSNIEIGNPSQNHFDKPWSVRLRSSMTAARTVRKVSFETAEKMREDHSKGLSMYDIMEKYGTRKTTTSYILSKKTYRRP